MRATEYAGAIIVRALATFLLVAAGCTGGGGDGPALPGDDPFVRTEEAVRAMMQELGANHKDLAEMINGSLSGGPDYEDQFGTTIRYEQTKGGFRLRSAGPDREYGTPDDETRDFSAKP